MSRFRHRTTTPTTNMLLWQSLARPACAAARRAFGSAARTGSSTQGAGGGAGTVGAGQAIDDVVFAEEEMIDLSKAGLTLEACHELGFWIFPRVVGKSDEEELLREVERSLRRDKYEDGHWDSAIKGFREVLKTQWRSAEAKAIVDRVRAHSALAPYNIAPTVHVLDLAPHGEVLPHVDSVKFVGGVVAGLSLMSSSIMRLKHPEKGTEIDVLLQPRSLYIMSKATRFDFTHEVLKGPDHVWRGIPFQRQRRVVTILREELNGQYKMS